MDRKLRESLSFRGALSFWDVFPEPPQGKLGVEILNPHHTRYYQQEVPPADCESPIPNFFLVVQPGATFIFHIQCTTNQLPDQLTSSWRQLLQVAFDHVFDWLGFGAKTSVGYGQMKLDKNARKTPEKNNLAVAESCLAGPDKKGLVRHPWLEETLLRIAKQTHCSDEEALRGKLLAEYWQALEDSDVKQAVLEDIRSCWEERGWWNNPTGRAIKKAKTIYEGKRS
jgi:CRISPR-associated protein Cmr6